ncbi:MAG: TrkH family potassium uptake protein [Cyanobacteria bacterium P01_H01_bin.121]
MTVSRTICLGFLAVIAAGTVLLVLPWASQADVAWDPLVALFTATSAVCVTGLSVVDVGTYYSGFGQLVIVLLAQVGGLGYMTATTFLLLVLGRKFRLRDKLALQQSLDTPGISGMRQLLRVIVAFTVVFELTGVFLLLPVFQADYPFGRALWFSIFHSISAFNNAGFGLFPDSFVQYQTSPLLNGAITWLIIMGGLGFQVIMECFLWLRDRLSRARTLFVFSLHCKIVTSTTIALLLIGTLGFLAIEFNNPNTLGPLNIGDKLMVAWFQSVTTRTAGFNSLDLTSMRISSLMLTIAFMFVGASPGSTGGGLKTTTLRILMMCTRAALRGEEEVTAYQRTIPTELILKAVGVVLASLMTVIISAILISIAEPDSNFLQILFEGVSAFATVGLSLGITSNASLITTAVLIPTMYVGRVGVLILIAAIFGDPRPSVVHYPEADLLVG